MDTPKSQKDWTVTLLLAIFLGYLGIHSFYAGNMLKGILQLLTGGGCGIWQLLDIIFIVMDKYKDGEGRVISNKK